MGGKKVKKICIFNQKGGVGKTTTVVNTASALGKSGRKVLIIDVDPQGNSTSGLGIEKRNLKNSIYEMLLGLADFNEVVRETTSKNVYIIPSGIRLTGFEIEIQDFEDKKNILKNRMVNKDLDYDYILIDCPPSLGYLSLNALCYADSILIPIQCEYYALEGVGQLMETYNLVRKSINKDLKIEGIVLTMYDMRNNLSLSVAEEAAKYFKDKVLKTKIPRNIRLAEAPSYGQSIFDYDSKSKGALCYEELAREIDNNNRRGGNE